MEERTLISFDWAIKNILRHKENFSVLEGLLSELIGFDVKIQNLLESEGNKASEQDKFNRVDILVKSSAGELMLIEVQYDAEDDYFHRMVYGISKLISEYISEGQPYGTVKKAYSINIVYFKLGQGKDYIYEYEGQFVGKKTKDILQPTNKQKSLFQIEQVSDIFPKYFVLRVGDFQADEPLETPLDEWMYFLKKSSIKEEFKAKGLEEAKSVLNQYNMTTAERQAYQRHVENVRIEISVTQTAIRTGQKITAIKVAKEMLADGMNKIAIAKYSGLTITEVEKLANGGEINPETD